MNEVVVGNAWGDEGKGLVTDWLSDDDSVVVRYCSGAQAGHTVVAPDGRRHVFHHTGSGSFRGAATFLSEFFFCDPVYFNKEFNELRELGITPEVLVSPHSVVVTPYDRLLNRITESTRSSRHGSCGYGVGEAARKAETPMMYLWGVLTYGILRIIGRSLRSRATLCQFLKNIEDDFYHQLALRQIEVDPSLLSQDVLQAHAEFLGAVPQFLANTRQCDFDEIRHRRLIFEGAQGLLLDRDLGSFPYVTRAKTGLVNVEKLLGTLEGTRVWFVSRSYSTRHGPGPFPGEDPNLYFKDTTNSPNRWQGVLRFAPRSESVLHEARSAALHEVRTVPSDVRTFITWTDVEGAAHLRTDGWSDGPTRDHCHIISKS